MPIQLSEVLFPLRYDVWDQATALAGLMDGCEDVLELLEAARTSAIHRHVVIGDPVYQAIGALAPRSGADLEYRIERYYGARVQKLFDYYHGIKLGWDQAQDRIYFKRVVDPTVTSAGNPVPEGLFLANGQHRVIALLALGYTELPDHIAAIEERTGEVFVPLDMTWPYIKSGDLNEAVFVDFARLRFPEIPEEIEAAQELADWMKDNGPEWVVEYIKLYWRTA